MDRKSTRGRKNKVQIIFKTMFGSLKSNCKAEARKHHLAEHTESDLLPCWVSLKQNQPTSVFNKRPTFSVSVFCIFPLFFVTASKANQMLLPILYELFLAIWCEGILDFLIQPLSKKAK